MSFDEWKAMDTLSGHARHRACGFLGTSWCPDLELPFAGGGADLRAARAGESGRGYHGGAWAENPKAAAMTEDDLTTRVAAHGWRGITENQDLANLDPSDDPRLALSFFVYKPDSTSRVAGRNPNVRPGGVLNLFDVRAPAGRIGALARAEIYFSRPQRRSDGALELPSLYSPYWKVRLVAPNAADRAYAALRQNNLTLGP